MIEETIKVSYSVIFNLIEGTQLHNKLLSYERLFMASAFLIIRRKSFLFINLLSYVKVDIFKE